MSALRYLQTEFQPFSVDRLGTRISQSVLLRRLYVERIAGLLGSNYRWKGPNEAFNLMYVS